MATIDIGGRLHSAASGHVVAGANEVFDDNENKNQQTINAELREAVGTGGSLDEKIAAAVNTERQRAQSVEAGKQDAIPDLSTIRSGAEAGATAQQPATTLAGYGITDAYTKTEGQALETVVVNRMNSQDAAIAALAKLGATSVETVPDVADAEDGMFYCLPGTNSYEVYMKDLTADPVVMRLMSTYTFPGVDSVPTDDSENLVKGKGIKGALNEIDYRISWVRPASIEVESGYSIPISRHFPINIKAGKIVLKCSTSIGNSSSNTYPTIYFHYVDGTILNGSVMKPGDYEFTLEKDVDYIYFFGTFNWTGTYNIDIAKDIEERLIKTFINRDIDVPCNIIGGRYPSGKGVLSSGEFNTSANSVWRMSNVLRVSGGKIKAYHPINYVFPWLYVYFANGTYQWYMSDIPNAEVASGTDIQGYSEFNLPNDAVAIQFVTRTTLTGAYQKYIPDSLDSVDVFVKNNVVDCSDKFSNSDYILEYGNEYGGGGNFYSTDYLEVEEGDIVESAVKVFRTAAYSLVAVAFYDADKCIIGCVKAGNDGSQGTENIYTYQEVPTGTKYVRFCCNTVSIANYYAFIHRSGNGIVVKKEEKDCQFVPLTYNTNGKEIVLFGDSITQGESSSDFMNNSYAAILRKMFKLEHDGNLNYGFCGFAVNANYKDLITLVSSTGWTRNFASPTVLGGDRYETSVTDSVIVFNIRKSCHYIKVSSEFASGLGTYNVEQGNTVLATVSLNEATTRIGTSALIDVSACDFTQNFQIRCVSGSVNVSGIVSIDNADDWTFNNYGRSGAPASLFTGDLFDAQAENASVMVYALGVNSDWQNVRTAFDSIKDKFKALNAVKVVLDVCNYSAAKISNTRLKKQLIRNLAYYVGAKYICVGDYYPKDANGDAISGFFAADNTHPTDAGHQFIAELIAKNIGLSVNSKGLANMLTE